MATILIVKDLMTNELVCVQDDTSMARVAEIFDSHSFHHLPVLNSDGVAVGIISKHDYFQLQHHFSRLDHADAHVHNTRFFCSLIAREVMSPDPVCVKDQDPIIKVIDIFLQNNFHAVLVTEDEKCIGVITTYDIVKWAASILSD